MRGDAFIHSVSGSRRVNIRLGVLLLIPKSPQIYHFFQECYPKIPTSYKILLEMHNFLHLILMDCNIYFEDSNL